MADSITTLQPDNTLVTFIQNTEPLIGVIEPDVDIINITTESTLIEFTTLGTQGMAGARGEKGDKLLYSELSLLEKQEIASLVEIDSGVLVTDLLANYILNKE